ncbi:hypothetical protein SAY87_010934 [Trapa incisa]|uniref:Homeobox domain-containing protein n=1 Tax=Trapa incisa TaxID=236973 RepID=A0AAN7JID3_9MYRT|nr:hypothetical protein SAY87_010934 [Trapa incisa]
MEGSNIHPFYHGRSDFQIKRIKEFFGECPYPNHDQLLKLNKEIGLPQKIVRFWFQNHAAQVKMRQARTDDEKLRAMKEVLRAEKEMTKMLRAEKEMCKMLRAEKEMLIAKYDMLRAEKEMLIAEYDRLQAKLEKLKRAACGGSPLEEETGV